MKKITKRDLDLALTRLKLMKFFPGDPGVAAALQELLARICPHLEALEWLVTTLVNRVPEWPGAHAIRGLLCTKYDAADGVDAYCEIPGFTPADCEARYFDAHQNLKAGGWAAPAVVQKLAAGRDMKRITGERG